MHLTKQLLFDASIHLGQFTIRNEVARIACKNAQVALSVSPVQAMVGAITFNENSWVDHVVWALDREAQDAFYPFMDYFHSVVALNRVPLAIEDAALAVEIAQRLPALDPSSALTLAVASRYGIAVQTLYPTLLSEEVQDYAATSLRVTIERPIVNEEQSYTDSSLEQRYQTALHHFRNHAIAITSLPHA